ncbi:MAG: hypothetical protein JNM84_19660 [Planctomycetes bacterium]|nr:hypothetical protein [Planctomycetota bacterium]
MSIARKPFGLLCTFALASIAGLSTPAKADSLIFTGSLAEGDATETDRHFRGGNPSRCGAAKPFAGSFTTGGQHFFDTHSFTNSEASTRCFRIQKFGTSDAFPLAYLGSFDPNARGTNYLGDASNSGEGTIWEIEVPSGATVVLVVETVAAGSTVGSYTVFVTSARNFGMTWEQTKSGALQQWDFTDDGSLAFDSYAVSAPFGPLGGFDVVDCCDANGDLEQDYILREAKLGWIGMLVGSTLERGTPGRFQILGAVSKEVEYVCCADLDADGDGDLVLRNTKTNEVVLWRLEDGVVAETLTTVQEALAGLSIAACCDLDDDGDADFVWTQPKTGAIAIWRSDASQLTTPEILFVEVSSAIPGPDSLVLTQKGWILASCSGGRLLWFHSKTRGLVDWSLNEFSGGAARFDEFVVVDEAAAPLFLPKGLEPVGIGNFDAAGNLDLCVRNLKAQQIGWYLDYNSTSNTLTVRGPDAATTSVGLDPLDAEEAGRVGDKAFAIRCPHRNKKTK